MKTLRATGSENTAKESLKKGALLTAAGWSQPASGAGTGLAAKFRGQSVENVWDKLEVQVPEFNHLYQTR